MQAPTVDTQARAHVIHSRAYVVINVGGHIGYVESLPRGADEGKLPAGFILEAVHCAAGGVRAKGLGWGGRRGHV